MNTLIPETDRQLLLKLARKVIATGCTDGMPTDVDITQYSSTLNRQLATFVTLQKNGNLRGCIGSLRPHRTLVEDVASNAFASAFRDHRFAPVTETELYDITIEISILTPMERMDVHSEAELLKELQDHKDGLLIQNSTHSATFLPQVWEQLPDPSIFLKHLKQKAGIPIDQWHDDMNCYRYRCIKFGE